MAGTKTNSNLVEQEKLDQWLEQAVAGDLVAFEALYELYSQPIFTFCFFRAPTKSDAEDLTAQVFMKAWQAIGRYRVGEAPFLAWLYRIAHNTVANYYRDRQRHPEVADAGLDDNLLENIEDQGELGSDPLEAIFRQTQRETLKKALERLTKEQQQVVYLRFIEDWSHAQIASLIGKKENAVRGIQFRALSSLEKILSKKDLV